MANDTAARFNDALRERVLVLDGGMGTMLLGRGLREEDFRGEEFSRFEGRLGGNLDLLTLTRPDLVEGVHRAYLNAGADIITTNTFNANATMQRRYGMEDLVERMNREAAELARRVAADFAEYEQEREIFVVGSVGPGDAVADNLPSELLPGYRRESPDRIQAAFREQTRALIAGGVDAVLVESIYAVGLVRSAGEGIREAASESGREIVLWVSGTPDRSGERLLSGEGWEEFVAVAEDQGAGVIGVNCGYGYGAAATTVWRLSGMTELPLSMHPSAGIPDGGGMYPEDPEVWAEGAGRLAGSGMVRIVGGCCGTTPEHIRALVRRGFGKAPGTRG